ncbi:unnamed protein product [Trifolium pratense]|uniref:Uncharacterized protein n=1 Tax=Trifolium pratense TaxID=57577 RepID=A0ACB0K5R9_TRIPR|nr:unnamed protein product [Trifolium pratense]
MQAEPTIASGLIRAGALHATAAEPGAAESTIASGLIRAVALHATAAEPEIMFTDDQTYNSLGRHIFDIYIQNRLVLKDFNIAKEAGGGTTGIPFDSVYGLLISAISVDPGFLTLHPRRKREVAYL